MTWTAGFYITVLPSVILFIAFLGFMQERSEKGRNSAKWQRRQR